MTNKQPKEFEKLCFSDRFMYGKVMEDKERCRKVLECLLNRPIGELQEVATEREMSRTKDGKMIRMDLYTKDDRAIYNAEMQNLPEKKTVESLELPKRSRYYHSLIDVDFLKAGHLFKELPENNVIFICTFDPCGKGEPIYNFTFKTDTNPSIHLNDGSRIIFFNCTYEGDEIPEKLRNFYEFVRTGRAKDELTRDLEHAVEAGRMNRVYCSEYIKQEQMRRELLDEGMEEERVHTEEQRKRAEVAETRAENAETRAEAAEAEVERLKKLLAKVGG